MEAQKIMAVAASILMLAACSSPGPAPAPQAVTPPGLNLNNAQDVAGASVVQRDEYGTTTIYRGPNLASKAQDQLFILARKTDAGSVTYQIYIAISYSGVWRFYNWAYDDDGKTLDLTLLSRNLAQCQNNDCMHNEHVSVDMTRRYLEEHIQSGLRFWLSGKAGKEEFFIPPGYIKAFLPLSDTSR